MLKFEDEIEKRTQYTLEMIGSTESLFEQTNSPELHALLTDVKKAIEEADLTEIQAEAVRLYYFEGYTLQEVADIGDVKDRSTASRSVKSAIKKIAKVFEEWDYWTEGESYVPRIY